MSKIVDVLGFNDKMLTVIRDTVAEHTPGIITYITKLGESKRHLAWYIRLSSLSEETQKIIRQELDMELEDNEYEVKIEKKKWWQL